MRDMSLSERIVRDDDRRTLPAFQAALAADFCLEFWGPPDRQQDCVHTRRHFPKTALVGHLLTYPYESRVDPHRVLVNEGLAVCRRDVDPPHLASRNRVERTRKIEREMERACKEIHCARRQDRQ